MSDDDVIELGEDGAFDIPVSVQAPKFTKIAIVEEDSDDDVVYPDPPVENVFNTSVIDSLGAKEYKMFKNDKTLFLIFKLGEVELVKSVSLLGQQFRITTTAGEECKIEIPSEYKFLPQRISCKVLNNIVSSSIELI